VWLDGVRVATPGLYRASLRAQRVVYATHLDAGGLVLQFRVTGGKNVSSASTRVRFDAVTTTVASTP
jgi:hypothetical protein